MKPAVLIVDDDEEIRTQMRWALADDYEPLLADSRESALKVFKDRQPGVVLLDLGLPPNPNNTTEGMAILAELLAEQPATRIIVITGQTDREHALRAIEAGAHDFLAKPVQMEELKILLKRATVVADLKRANRLATTGAVADAGFAGLIGNSPAMHQIYGFITKVAGTSAPVLILGESGTGKEMAAQAIHLRSSRRDAPFVAINCGAIPEALLESELFGHEKGSFTGAHTQRKGRVETAEGGTLFLDEIGEMPPALQVKLLRFLQERKIERIGGRVSIDVDVRIIAATNLDLALRISEGRFREDLYYRLAVVNLSMPPLKSRPGDVLLLAQSFIEQFAREHGKVAPKFTLPAQRALEHHAWPGNVRELQNRVRRAFIMHESASIRPEDLELLDTGPKEPNKSLKAAREELERGMVLAALRRNQGKISHAAAELGISRPTLYELLEKLGIKNEERPAQ